MNKTALAGLAALVMAGCEDNVPLDKTVDAESFTIPRGCAEIINLHREYRGRWQLACKTSDGKEVYYFGATGSRPWYRCPIERK